MQGAYTRRAKELKRRVKQAVAYITKVDIETATQIAAMPRVDQVKVIRAWTVKNFDSNQLWPNEHT